MNERYECYKTERIKRFEKENICDEKKVEILGRYLRILMNRVWVLSNQLQVEYTLPDFWDSIIEEITNITHKIQVVVELHKDYKNN